RVAVGALEVGPLRGAAELQSAAEVLELGSDGAFHSDRLLWQHPECSDRKVDVAGAFRVISGHLQRKPANGANGEVRDLVDDHLKCGAAGTGSSEGLAGDRPCRHLDTGPVRLLPGNDTKCIEPFVFDGTGG